MAGLCTGISYGLSQNNLNHNKELVFVKLTDSAYRAIEEYQRNQAKINSHPTIQFDGNDGFLSFPSLTNSLGQKFSFTITEVEGPQGSFECIQQNPGQLEILGSLATKMRIHAKDDVYETTRVRMAEAEEHQKKKSTREIKPNQTDIGRKVKLKNSFDRISNIPNNLSKRDSSQNNSISSINNNNNNNLINNNNSNSIINNNSNLNSINSSSNVSNQSSLLGITSSLASGQGTGTASSASLLSSKSNNNQSGLVNSNNNNSCSNLSVNNLSNLAALSNSNNINNNNIINNNTNSLGLLSQASAGNGGMMNGSSPSNGGNHVNNINNNSNVLPISNGCQNGIQKSGNNRNSQNNNNSNNSGSRNNDLMKRPIKERLIHLLAVRPYKKPEVYARITSEGVRERDKQNIINVLKAISFLRDNSYHLHRYIWNDVQEDWPFYTEQEKATLKRRKPQNLTPPLSSDGGSSTSGQSPTSTHNGSPPPPVKRPSMMNNNEKVLEGPIAKKQRISHYKKDNVTQENTTSRRGTNDSRDSSNMNPRSREPEELPTNNYFGSNITPNAHESEDSGMSLSYSVLNTEATKRITSTIPITNNQDLDGADEEQHELQVEMDNQRQLLNGGSPNNNHDFSTFTRITTIEQRRKYKTEFDNDYTEYRKLYDEIDQTSKRFELLGERLRNEKHNNRRYKDIQKQILAEYRQKMRDSHHQKIKRRFDYLHQKLSLIKRLVNEYDTTLTKTKHLAQQSY